MPRAKLATILPVVDRLARAGDGAGLDQLNDAVGDHFGVHAEVLLAFEKAEQRLRDAPDAEFQGAAVFDQSAAMYSAIWRVVSVTSRRRHLQNRRLGGDEHVDVIDVNEGVAQRARHVRVHLRDDQRSVLRRAFHDIDRDAEAAHAVFVRRRHLNERDVQRQLAGIEQARDVRQKDGRVIAQALLDDVAHVFRNKEAVHPEVLRQFAVRIRRIAEGQQVQDLCIGQLVGPLGQGRSPARAVPPRRCR